MYTQTHTHMHTHTLTHTRKLVLTLTQHEYSTQWNALFCIILLYKMLEVHVFFKLCRWCNCNGDNCVCQMRMKKMMMMMIRRRSFCKREKEVVNLSGLINVFLSGEFWQNRAVCLKQLCIRTELLHCYEWMMLFWRTSSTISLQKINRRGLIHPHVW